MLVLSRRANEKIVFPTLGITIEVCSLHHKVVRLGIDAPPEVPILREEIALDAPRLAAATGTRHQTRNRLHIASLALHLAQKQLQAGLNDKADATLADAIQQFAAIDQEMAAANRGARKEIRALLVEDNRNESALLAEFLRLHGIKVETACDGQDALDYLQAQERPDVILLDMRMPRCDGPTTIAAIRRNAAYDGLKVFAVSGADQEECAGESGAFRVDRWFTKPVNPVKLVQEMNRSLSLN